MVSALERGFIWPGTVSVLEENRSSLALTTPCSSRGGVSSEKNWAHLTYYWGSEKTPRRQK